jgi:hypothetical protein
LGLDDQSEILGIFQTGTLIHEFLEEHLAEEFPQAAFEREIDVEVGGIRFVGRTDCYDPETLAVYDFKTRNGWYNFDPPTQRHLDQLYVYMAGVGVGRGQLVYLSKSDLEVRTWPEDDFVDFDQERFDELLAKAQRIRDYIRDEGYPDSPADIPFERCGCYFCENETLVDDFGGESDAQ